MPPEELFSQFSLSEWWIYVLNLTPFASILSSIYMGESGYESGSTTLHLPVMYTVQ